MRKPGSAMRSASWPSSIRIGCCPGQRSAKLILAGGSVCLFARRAPCWVCLTRCAFRIRHPKALAWSIATFVRACARLVGSDSRELGCRHGAGVRNVSLYAGIPLLPRSFRLFKNLALRLFPRGCAGRMASCRCAVDKKRTFAVLSSALSQESHSSPGFFSECDSLCFRRRVKSCRKSPFSVQVPDWPAWGAPPRSAPPAWGAMRVRSAPPV